MGLLTKSVIIKWSCSNKKYYENKGYKFTRYKDEFEVKVKDLTVSNGTKVTAMCDCCNKTWQLRWLTYNDRIKENNKIYCYKCTHKLYAGEASRKTKLKNGISFKQWCINNNRQDILERWDYELNDYNPDEVSYMSNKKCWFKCPLRIHDSELKKLELIARNNNSNIICKKCNSFGQWLINNYGENAIELYWSDKNIIDSFEIECGSSKRKVWLKCPICNHEKQISPYEFINYNFSCPKCGDGISYPNKFAFNLLEQLGIDFINEYSPDWIKPKKYDFYFELNDKKYILEMDGSWHNVDNTLSGQTKEQSQKIDKYKDDLANSKDITVIRIDCQKSDLEYIKNNILNSNISSLFNLNKINWNKCNEFACGSIVKKVCDLWNSGKGALEISNQLKIGRSSVNKYLHRGVKNNWCDYNGKDAIKLKNKQQSKIVYCIELDYVFESLHEAERKTNIPHNTISQCCKGDLKSAGKLPDGTKLHWMYYEDWLKLQKESA